MQTVDRFRAARQAGNYELAAQYLSKNPRVWFDTREGEGSTLISGAGPWTEWDKFFRATSSHGRWSIKDDSVWTEVTEMNDYHRLIERQSASKYLVTYYFDDEGKILGYLVSDILPGQPTSAPVDRLEEIKAWALENFPEEWEYLRPEGRIDPSGDRPLRTRQLLNKWRKEVGLQVIE